MINILSIDWDYFVDCTEEQRMYWFPDGGNEHLPQVIQSSIWASRYAANPIETLKVDRKALSQVKRIIKKGTVVDFTMFMMTDSHKYIFDEVLEYMDGLDEPIRIINIDFHHDGYGLRHDQVNCGNWVNHIFDSQSCWRAITDSAKEYSEYWWIRRKESDVSKSLAENPWYYEKQLSDLKEFVDSGEQFDMVYICRSGMWSPPHMDSEFTKFCEAVWPSENPLKEEVGIRTTTRYDKKFKDDIETLKAIRNNFELECGVKSIV